MNGFQTKFLATPQLNYTTKRVTIKIIKEQTKRGKKNLQECITMSRTCCVTPGIRSFILVLFHFVILEILLPAFKTSHVFRFATRQRLLSSGYGNLSPARGLFGGRRQLTRRLRVHLVRNDYGRRRRCFALLHRLRFHSVLNFMISCEKNTFASMS